jgi:hypothetical protein
MLYTICNEPDEEIFVKQCSAIEKNIPGLKKDNVLEDVDGTKIQIYHYGENLIKVINSFYVNALYVESTEDIKKYF